MLGALCEVFLVITNIGTALVLWPIVRRQSQTLALSYVASRTVESSMILVGQERPVVDGDQRLPGDVERTLGAISLLSVVTLREDLAGTAAVADPRRQPLRRNRRGEALDLVAEGQEALPGEVEAVVGPQLAVADVDVDLFLEIEQLEDGQGVPLAVD